MNELSDSERDKTSDKKDGAVTKDSSRNGDSVEPNSNENASRPIKMVESSSQKSSSANSDSKSEKSKPPDKYNNDRQYDSKDRPPYRGVNGVRPSPGSRGRRDEDRRPSPTKQNFRNDRRNERDGRMSSRGANSGSYRDRRDNDKKQTGNGNFFKTNLNF